MRWLIVLPSAGVGEMGMDFRAELLAMGHDVRMFAYRRRNVLYKNKSTKAAYQLWILRRLERLCMDWEPRVVLVVKGGPVTPGLIRRVKARRDSLFLNYFPDSPLVMIPFERIEAYDLFFTKEPYAIRQFEQVGLRNLHYLPAYCTPEFHHPVDLTEDEARTLEGVVSLVGSCYPYRERLARELSEYPLRIWGPGWDDADPAVRRLVAGGFVRGRDKLAVYCGARLSLNPHHPMDIEGVNHRTFELAAAGACQVVSHKSDLPGFFKPGDEVVAYRDLPELRRQLDHYLAHPDEARAIGANARRRALAEHTLRHRLDEMVVATEARFGRL